MIKHSIDDIIPPSGRSIRKVAPIKRTARRPQASQQEQTQEMEPVQNQRIKSGRRASRFGFWVVALLCVAVLGFVFSIFFSGAKIVVTPKQRTVLVSAEFTAIKTPGVNELGYETMTISREGSTVVSASGEEIVTEKASGKIVVYNDYSSANQRLIKNTRFETPEGLVYRINESVVVPGQKSDGSSKIPGSIEVTVYADEAGEKYNGGLTDFTIPGFKGDPRFDDFYARSKTEMTGGFNGPRKVVSVGDKQQAKEKIESGLREQLFNEAFSQKPEGYELYEDGLFIVFEDLPYVDQGSSVEVREMATLYGVLFAKDVFAHFVAKETLAGFDNESVRLLDANSIDLKAINKEDAQPWKDDSFTFTLSGNAHIVWLFDQNQLKDDLVGKAKGAFQTILTGYPSIDEAQIVLRPFWRQTFPEKADDIKVELIINR